MTRVRRSGITSSPGYTGTAMAQRRSTPRVLILVNDLALGGAQRVVQAQAAALDRARFIAHVASLELLPGGPLARELERAGVPVHRLRRRGEPRLMALPRLLSLLRFLRPELVHTHLAAAGVVGRVAARRAAVPRVASTLHNLSDWEQKRAHPLRLMDRRTLPLADGIVAVSDAVRGAFARACPRLAARAVTVRNGVDVAAFACGEGDRRAARATLGFGAGELVVAAVARLESRKGLDILVEAAAIAVAAGVPLRLLVVGEGPERGRLQRLAHARGLTGRVHWAGGQDDVRPHLAAADLFAAPSRTEGLGVSVIEALAAGVPALASRVGGLPELLEGAPCGRLLPAGEPVAWAVTIAELAADRAALRRMAAAAPAHAARFSLEASALALQAVYDRLLGAASPALAEAA